MAKGDFSPTELSWDFDLYEKYKPREFSQLVQSYSAIWQDLEYFPLPKENVSYVDTWMARRSYGKDLGMKEPIYLLKMLRRGNTRSTV